MTEPRCPSRGTTGVFRRPRVLLVLALALAAGACGDDNSPPSVVATRPSSTGCPASPGAVATSATLELGPAPGLPTTTAPGEPMVISGTVYDVACTPVEGVALHVWQTDGAGVYGPGHGTDTIECCYLQGTVRSDAEGRYRLVTVRPGHYQGESPPPPAHIHLDARHQQGALQAEIVFSDDPHLSNPDLDGYLVVTLAPSADDPAVQAGTADLILTPS